MSSTNRGAIRKDADFYATPMAAFIPLLPFLEKGKQHWECACGDSRLVTAMQNYGIDAVGTDLRTGHDFLESTRTSPVIITNPPFSLAFEFCVHAHAHADEVWMLLRLNFLASKKRSAWFKQHEPAALFILSSRPDFTGGGGDSCDYAWFYWGSRHRGIFHL